MKLREIKLGEALREASPKAGIIPYLMADGTPIFVFMVSSNAAYGGPDPAIAKGRADPNEDIKKTAVREGEEELGLKLSNMKLDTLEQAWQGRITGLDAVYDMTVLMVEVKSKDDFNSPDHEVAEVVWMSNEEFKKQGRKSHAHIVQSAHDKIVRK